MTNSSIFKMTEEETKALYRELGSNEATIKSILFSLDELRSLIKILQEEVFKIKLTAEITKMKLVIYGSLGGAGFSVALFFFKFFISKMGVQND